MTGLKAIALVLMVQRLDGGWTEHPTQWTYESLPECITVAEHMNRGHQPVDPDKVLSGSQHVLRFACRATGAKSLLELP